MSEENTPTVVALDAPTAERNHSAEDMSGGVATPDEVTKSAPRKRATRTTTPRATTTRTTATATPATATPRATTTRKPRTTKKAAEAESVGEVTPTLANVASTLATGGAESNVESIFSDSRKVINDGAPQTGRGAPDANVQVPLPLDAPPQVLATVKAPQTVETSSREHNVSQEARESQPVDARSTPEPTQESAQRSSDAVDTPPASISESTPSVTSGAPNNGTSEGAQISEGDNRMGADGRLRFRGRDGREMRQGRTFRGRGNAPENGEYRPDNNGNGQAESRQPESRPEGREGYTENRPDTRPFQNGQGRRGRFGQFDNRDNQGREGQSRESQGREGQGQGREPQPPRRPELDWATLEEKNVVELREIARELGATNTLGLKSHDLMMRILEVQAEQAGNLIKHGIIEMQNDGKGFLRCSGYLQTDGDVYVSQSQIKRFNLKTGDMVTGLVRAPKEMERYHGLLRVEAINGESPEAMKTRKEFEKLTPIFPEEKFKLEIDQTNVTARIIDLVSPIGKGQRGLIVAPPKAGKTTLLKSIANSISLNHPDVTLIVLLIDERPEEVTDISRSVRGEVVASTFDEMPENHMRVAELVFEKAKRLVEQHKDVVILLDSITRLSRASNLVVTPSGRTLSGGLDPAAMYRPKRMFGAARNIEEGGSLTILATTLVDTGSRMDEMIFEEFKGTGNMDLVLDRDLFNQRIFPAIDINKSGTRRDDLLMSKDDLAAIFHLRRTLAALDNDKAITLLIDRLKNTKTNSDFMAVVQRSQRNSANPSVAGG